MTHFSLSQSDLEELSQEELYELATKMHNYHEAIKRRKTDYYFERAHEGQQAFHKATNRIRVFLGGNRSGKTTGGTNDSYLLASGKHPVHKLRVPNKGLIVAQDFTTHVNDIIIPKIEEWYPPEFIPQNKRKRNQAGVTNHFTCSNGSKIDIKSHDQKLKVFEGSDYDWVWFDEPPPEAVFKAVWRGLTDRGGIAIITGTPIVEPWMYDMICEADKERMKGLVWYQYVDSYDNAKNIGEGDEELGKKRLKEFEATLDPDEREARIKGKFLHLAGLIFKSWSRRTHLIDPFPWPTNWPIWYSIDPHPRKPWAVSFIGMSPTGHKYLLSSALIDGVCEDVAQFIFHMRDQVKLDKPGHKPRIVRGLIDNYASVESMVKQTTIIDELNDHLYPLLPKVKTAPKDVSQKISIFKEWLKVHDTKYGKKPTFMAFNNEENQDFLYEIEHYRWSKYQGKGVRKLKDVPEKEDDDILDSIMQVALTVGKEAVESSREVINYRKGKFRGRGNFRKN